LNASISFVVPLTGTYYVNVRGTGKGDPLLSGYTAYGSIGRYTVNVTAPADGISSPVSIIRSNVTAGNAPLTVVFSGASSTPSAGSITSYEWNFGDGSPVATGVSVSHTYNAAGTYAATLKVTNSGGLTDISSVTITVISPQPKVFVDNIGMQIIQPWRGGKPYVRASITVKDSTGKLIPSAVVYGAWSGIVNGNSNGTTNATGVAVVNSPSTNSTGVVNFAVTGITVSGYAYDASLNKMTSNSINK
jgi:PKD repeat protein